MVGKKISVTVKEANVEKQTAFAAPIQQLDHNKVFYLDEAGFNPADQRNTGWGPTQDRLKGFKTGLRYTKDRVFVISAYQHSKLISPMVYKETMDSVYFNTTITKVLLPFLPQGSIVILDNASVRKSSDLPDIF